MQKTVQTPSPFWLNTGGTPFPPAPAAAATTGHGTTRPTGGSRPRPARIRAATILYTKTADDFVRDYRLLTDHCVRMGHQRHCHLGFCRDAHGRRGGEQEVCNYAADRGIRIMPGVGTSVYGGVYYVSDQTRRSRSIRSRQKSFVAQQRRRASDRQGRETFRIVPVPDAPDDDRVAHGMRAVVVRHVPNRRRQRRARRLHHLVIATVARRRARDSVRPSISPRCSSQTSRSSTRRSVSSPTHDHYATYTGFAPDPSPEIATSRRPRGARCSPGVSTAGPEFARDLDARSICQWTLTDWSTTRRCR